MTISFFKFLFFQIFKTVIFVLLYQIKGSSGIHRRENMNVLMAIWFMFDFKGHSGVSGVKFPIIRLWI